MKTKCTDIINLKLIFFNTYIQNQINKNRNLKYFKIEIFLCLITIMRVLLGQNLQQKIKKI